MDSVECFVNTIFLLSILFRNIEYNSDNNISIWSCFKYIVIGKIYWILQILGLVYIFIKVSYKSA